MTTSTISELTFYWKKSYTISNEAIAWCHQEAKADFSSDCEIEYDRYQGYIPDIGCIENGPRILHSETWYEGMSKVNAFCCWYMHAEWCLVCGVLGESPPDLANLSLLRYHASLQVSSHAKTQVSYTHNTNTTHNLTAPQCTQTPPWWWDNNAHL